jgi:hypothetical protein
MVKKKLPIHYKLDIYYKLYLKAKLRVIKGKFCKDITIYSLVYQMFKTRYYVAEILFSKKENSKCNLSFTYHVTFSLDAIFTTIFRGHLNSTVTKLNSVVVRSLCVCTVCGRMSLPSVI